MRRVAIIVAGGTGKRMNSKLPKQFLRISDEVILMKTIRTFHEFDQDMDLVVGMATGSMSVWKEICEAEDFHIPHKVVKGGVTRFHTVKNALEHIPTPSAVAIHDGVRPLVDRETIRRAFNKAEESGNAIPVADIHESIRKVTKSTNETVPRDHYKLVQTPQVFKSDILIEAYKQKYNPDFTDDAMVVERTGIQIFTVKGNPENIKITTKKDLAVAGTLLKFMEK